MLHRPKAKTDAVLHERVGDELVVYDETTHVAHCLSATAASVWERCDGESSVIDISRQLGLDLAEVMRSVDDLERCALLEDPSGTYSRREMTHKLASIGGAAFAAPLIYSVAIPTAAAALSCTKPGHQQPGTATCTASAGAFGVSSGTGACCAPTTGTLNCYKANSAGSFWCVASNTSCSAKNGTCTSDSDCCDTTSGTCNTNSGKCSQ